MRSPNRARDAIDRIVKLEILASRADFVERYPFRVVKHEAVPNIHRRTTIRPLADNRS